MTPADFLISMRDEVYNKILAKKVAAGFTLTNSFDLVRTWRPWTSLEALAQTYPNGRVYVIGSRIDDVITQSRTNIVMPGLPIMVGYQRVITDIDAYAEIDNYVKFVGELVNVCILEVDPTLRESFSRIEWLRDNDGLPLSFIMLRDAFTFEAYFTAYYNVVMAGSTGE